MGAVKFLGGRIELIIGKDELNDELISVGMDDLMIDEIKHVGIDNDKVVIECTVTPIE